MLQHQSDFIQWYYGGGIVLDGLYRIDDTFGFDHKNVINKYLDDYIRQPNNFGYHILHNIPIPFWHNVGDQIGLFPINYLSRVTHSGQGYNKTTDLTIVTRVIYQYILDYIHKLGDGTLCRNYGWPAEPSGTDTFLWADDMYMGLTLVTRYARYIQNETLAAYAATQVNAFMRYLQDPVDGLLPHGANIADQHKSCCKWGRSNGWALMAQVEVLATLQTMPHLPGSSLYRELVSFLQWQIQGIVKYQGVNDGRWHQVINERTTFLETSATAIYISGISRAAIHGWISAELVTPTLKLAWIGLNQVISYNGTISGLCNGLSKYASFIPLVKDDLSTVKFFILQIWEIP